MGGDINSSKSVLGTIDGLLFTREFNSVFPARLKDAGLELLTVSDLSKADRDKLFNRLRDRSKDERSLQFLPVALVVHVVFSFLKDLDEAYGLKASEVTGYVEVIDNENGRTVLNHNFTSVRGFGSTQDDARRNAFKEVANGVLNTFIKAIKEESK